MLAFRKESLSDWYYVIRRIFAVGESVQVYAKVVEVENLVRNIGAHGLLIKVDASEEAQRLVERYGSE